MLTQSSFWYRSTAYLFILLFTSGIVRAFPILKGMKTFLPDKAVKYLSRFGYLPGQKSSVGYLLNSEHITVAIQSLQRNAHLPVTGILDEATEALLSKPRCGLPDNMPLSNRFKRYTPEGSKWHKTDLAWRLQNGPPGLNLAYLRKEIDAAVRLWSKNTVLSFREANSSREADIVIYFFSGDHGDGYPFDGRGSILAHAFFPGSGNGGDAHFDADEIWALSSTVEDDRLSLYSVAAHEFGHSLGLSHSAVEDALMYPWYRGDFVQGIPLPEDDLRGIQYLYAPTKRPFTPKYSTHRKIPSSTSTSLHTTTVLKSSTPASKPHRRKPNTCDTSYDAITLIRGQLFIFRDQYFWRIGDNGLEKGYPVKIIRFWPHFPSNLTHVDAVYERPDNFKIVFFVGYPRPLTDFGIPQDVDKIDAVIIWGHNGKTYFFSGSRYWRFDEKKSRVEFDYPRPMDVWKGVPYNIDSAFQYKNGKTYFFKDKVFWEFNDMHMKVKSSTPALSAPFWMGCPIKYSSSDLLLNQHSALHSMSAKPCSNALVSICVIVACSAVRASLFP